MCESLVKAWIDHIVMSEYFNMCWCLPLCCCKITCLLFKFKFTILILWDTGFIAHGTQYYSAKICTACVRLFLGSVFAHVDSILYITFVCTIDNLKAKHHQNCRISSLGSHKAKRNMLSSLTYFC